jgi:hypothetical protein
MLNMGPLLDTRVPRIERKGLRRILRMSPVAYQIAEEPDGSIGRSFQAVGGKGQP